MAIKLTNLFEYRKRKNNRGWLRVVEAAISVMIIVGVLLTVYIRNSSSRDLSAQVYDIQKRVLDYIASDISLRQKVVASTPDLVSLKTAVADKIPPNFDFEIKICPLDDSTCQSTVSDTVSVYVADRIIAEQSGPSLVKKKVRLFIWEKG